jgi:hypothetical protein
VVAQALNKPLSNGAGRADKPNRNLGFPHFSSIPPGNSVTMGRLLMAPILYHARQMSGAPPLPTCPKCRRPIAAWKMDHCVYCGAPFPAGFRDGVPEPDSLKWIDRPGIPLDASKQLELMKVLPDEKVRQPRSLVLALAGFSVPLFGAIFYLAYAMLKRYSETGAVAILFGGVLVVGYLVWNAMRAPRK